MSKIIVKYKPNFCVLLIVALVLSSIFILIPLSSQASSSLFMGGKIIALSPCTSPLGFLIVVNNPVLKSIPVIRRYMVLIPGTFLYPFGKIALNLHVIGLISSPIPVVCTLGAITVGSGIPILFMGISAQ